jgi:hypothetical protein
VEEGPVCCDGDAVQGRTPLSWQSESVAGAGAGERAAIQQRRTSSVDYGRIDEMSYLMEPLTEG